MLSAETVSAAGQLRSTEHSTKSYVAFAIWLFVATVALATLIALIAAPLLQAQEQSRLADAIYKTFSYLCHQLPERSFHLAGYKFAVCSRCTGLYGGFAAAALIYPLVRSLKRTDTPRVIWLILATLPLVVDFALTYFGVWQNNHLSRFTTGALLGGIAAFFVIPGLIDLSSKIAGRFKSEPPAVAGG